MPPKRHKHRDKVIAAKNIAAATTASGDVSSPVSLADIRLAASSHRPPIKDNPWGLDLFARRIPGRVGITLMAKFERVPTDAKGEPEMVPETIDVIVEILSKAIVNSVGDPIFDTKEGLAILGELDAPSQLAMFNQLPQKSNVTQVPEKNVPATSDEAPSS